MDLLATLDRGWGLSPRCLPRARRSCARRSNALVEGGRGLIGCGWRRRRDPHKSPFLFQRLLEAGSLEPWSCGADAGGRTEPTRSCSSRLARGPAIRDGGGRVLAYSG
jgi:hypothetical protein